MSLPRVSIAWIMIVVMAIAADCAILRAAVESFWLLAFLLTPAMTLWLLVFLKGVLDLRRRGSTGPFLLGYLAGGMIGTLGLLLVYAAWGAPPLIGPIERFILALAGKNGFEDLRDEAIVLVGLALPQIAAGLVGGGIASALGVTLATRRRLGEPGPPAWGGPAHGASSVGGSDACRPIEGA